MYIIIHSCIKDEWKSEKVDSSGVDFTELESGYREKVLYRTKFHMYCTYDTFCAI